jgi:hypothetical protein
MSSRGEDGIIDLKKLSAPRMGSNQNLCGLLYFEKHRHERVPALRVNTINKG